MNAICPHPCRLSYSAVSVMQTLRGKVAVVTGGSRGIGFAIAQALLAEGATVVITGRNEGHLADARRKLEATGDGLADNVDALRADVRNHAEIDRAIAAAVTNFG